MKLLLDANLSWCLAAKLQKHFEDCMHTEHTGLPNPATDIEIWNYAAENNLIIITNDEDFLNFVNVKGFPPKVIILRTGNQSNDFIEQLLIRHKNDIADLYNSSEYGFLEIYQRR